jgi:hypothetical protein
MTRLRYLVCFLLFGSGTCFGQSTYLGLTPGVSTRADIEKSLRQPVRAAGRTSQYGAPAGSESEIASIDVQYGAESDIAERIEVHFPAPLDRSAMIRALNLPDQPETTKDVEGKLVEYFGSPQWLALTYATGKQSSGISSMGFYNRDLFKSVLGRQAAKRPAVTPPEAKPSSGSTPGSGNSSSSGKAAVKPSVADAPQGKPPNGNALSSPAAKPSAVNPPEAKPSTDSTPGSPAANPPEAKASTEGAPGSYSGPSSGTIIWSGQMDADEVITIDGDHSIKGSVSGALPGVPVQVDVETKEFAIAEAPAPSNGWKRLAIRSKRKRQAVVSVHWSVLQ